MEKYKITDADGKDLEYFEENHQGAALQHANDFDKFHGLAGTKLWVQSGPQGDWYVL